MATEARPAFLAITGPLNTEALDAAVRFAAVLSQAAGESAAVDACSALAARAFHGDAAAWAPLVAAVRDMLAYPPRSSAAGERSRRELRAFVHENADLLDG